MFEEFSGGYYVGRLFVEPYDGDHAAMHEEQHVAVNKQVYASGEGVERLDNPLVMKVDQSHFPVHGAEDVPADTLAVPQEVLADTRIRDPPALKEVLLAKADQAGRLLRWFCPDAPTGANATLQ